MENEKMEILNTLVITSDNYNSKEIRKTLEELADLYIDRDPVVNGYVDWMCDISGGNVEDDDFFFDDEDGNPTEAGKELDIILTKVYKDTLKKKGFTSYKPSFGGLRDLKKLWNSPINEAIVPSGNKEGIMEFPKEWENDGEDDEYWGNKFLKESSKSFHPVIYDAKNLPYEMSDEYLQGKSKL